MNLKTVRWHERFEHFQKAHDLLKAAVLEADQLNRLEKEGLVKRFEYTFELAWKTLKDYLESQGITASFPREVIKTAFLYNLITDGELWMEMLENRNIMVHTYDEERFLAVIVKITLRYFPALTQALTDLEGRQ